MTNAMGRYIRGLFRRFKRSEDGVSAIEFAIIAPLMIMLYLGSVDLSLAFSIDRKATSAASALADLVAQDDVITDGEINDILAAGQAIIAPFPSQPMTVRITSLLADGDGDVEVQWSDADGRAPLPEGSTVDVPDGVLNPNTSVIMVEVEYLHRPIFSQLGVSEFNINETFYLRPRRSIVVARS